MAGVGLGVVGGGGLAVDQARRRKMPGSGELGPTRRGPAALLDVMEEGTDARPRQCEGGGGSSAWSQASPAMAEGAERRRRAFACVEAGLGYL